MQRNSPPSLPPTAPSASQPDDATVEAFTKLLAQQQKEIVSLREQLQEKPTIGQVEKLQQQLREQKSEILNLRIDMEKMHLHMQDMASLIASNPPSKTRETEPIAMDNSSSRRGLGELDISKAKVSAEVVPLQNVNAGSLATVCMFV